MGLFKTVGGFLKGKSRELDETIQDANRVLYAENAIKDMEEELSSGVAGLSKIKATLMGIESDLKDKTEEFEKTKEKAKLLKEKGSLDLAGEMAQKCIDIKGAMDSLQTQKDTISKSEKNQEANVNKLRSRIESSKRQMQMVKTNEQTIKSTQSIVSVNLSGSENALSRFDEIQRKQQAEMNEANAMLEIQEGSDLDSRVEKELGNSSVNDFLNDL